MTAVGKRRFIAGAICPRCGIMDHIVVEYSQAGQQRNCIGCGFSDQLIATETPAAVLPTRVNSVPGGTRTSAVAHAGKSTAARAPSDPAVFFASRSHNPGD